jgi:hypothetical protein
VKSSGIIDNNNEFNNSMKNGENQENIDLRCNSESIINNNILIYNINIIKICYDNGNCNYVIKCKDFSYVVDESKNNKEYEENIKTNNMKSIHSLKNYTPGDLGKEEIIKEDENYLFDYEPFQSNNDLDKNKDYLENIKSGGIGNVKVVEEKETKAEIPVWQEEKEIIIIKNVEMVNIQIQTDDLYFENYLLSKKIEKLKGKVKTLKQPVSRKIPKKKLRESKVNEIIPSQKSFISSSPSISNNSSTISLENDLGEYMDERKNRKRKGCDIVLKIGNDYFSAETVNNDNLNKSRRDELNIGSDNVEHNYYTIGEKIEREQIDEFGIVIVLSEERINNNENCDNKTNTVYNLELESIGNFSNDDKNYDDNFDVNFDNSKSKKLKKDLNISTESLETIEFDCIESPIIENSEFDSNNDNIFLSDSNNDNIEIKPFFPDNSNDNKLVECIEYEENMENLNSEDFNEEEIISVDDDNDSLDKENDEGNDDNNLDYLFSEVDRLALEYGQNICSLYFFLY